MSFFKKIFGGKKNLRPLVSASASDRPPAPSAPAPVTDQAKGSDLIRVHDAYGREMFITKQQWRDNVLLGDLEKKRDRPDDLAGIIVQSLYDGFAADILPYAAHLATIDPTPERGHVLHAVTLLDLKRYADAETVLLHFCQQHGETGVVLTNLAKTYAGRGDDARALQTLWRALTFDPNQDNGLRWYEVIHREKDGPASGFDALRRIATLPGAWRARLWIARHHLEQRDLPAALALYAEALDTAPRPVPADLLQQMSGDLGNHAHLPELIRLTTPHYDIALHGLPTGNNLIKAHLDLGQLAAARALLDRLYAQQRPDWRPALSFLDTELAKASTAIADSPAPEKLEVTVLTLGGPVWLPPGTPAAELFPAKPADAPVVAFLGATAEMPPGGGEPHRLQLADGPGRLSRALPLWLAEQVEFGTEAATRTLVPWLVNPPSFVLSGVIENDTDAASHARHVRPEEKPADYIVVTHLNCRADPWTIELRLVRTIDAACLATASATCPASDPAQVLPGLTRTLLAALDAHAEINASPPVSAFNPQPSGAYLLRLEQLLAVRTAGQAQASGTLSGERDILDGHLQLCLSQPESVSIRLLFAQTLRGMKKVRADILPEFRSRVNLLQKEKPLPEPAQSVIARIIAETFAA